MLTTSCGGSTTRPVQVVPPAAGPPTADADCARLQAALPPRLDPDLARRPTAPASPRTAAWGSRPVVLRCGTPRPEDLRSTSNLTEVNGVAWFQRIGDRAVSWTAVDRAVYVELTVPTSYVEQSGFLVDIGAAVATALPPLPVDTTRS